MPSFAASTNSGGTPGRRAAASIDEPAASGRAIQSRTQARDARRVWGGRGLRGQVHIGATALHYGQACFEGLKAFAQADGTVRLFRPDENAARMKNSCDRLLMAAPPAELFLEACRRAVAANLEYVPPHGSGGALYVRPLLFGSGPRIGLQPADE